MVGVVGDEVVMMMRDESPHHHLRLLWDFKLIYYSEVLCIPKSTIEITNAVCLSSCQRPEKKSKEIKILTFESLFLVS